MNNLNSILIEGNFVRDPEFRSTAKGTSICTFAIASNRYFKQNSGFEKEASYFNVEAWAKLAESCYHHGHKGRGVRIVGRLKQEHWNDREGKAQSRVVIVAKHVEFRPEYAERKEEAVENAEVFEASF
jgi:single-strand DNA-binding protein